MVPQQTIQAWITPINLYALISLSIKMGVIHTGPFLTKNCYFTNLKKKVTGLAISQIENCQSESSD